MGPSEFIAIRTAMLPGGYAIFLEPGAGAADTAAKLKGLGYTIADPIETAIPGYYAVRAR
jgi:hypothetical protein